VRFLDCQEGLSQANTEMCPMCISTVLIATAGAGSGAGLLAVFRRRLRGWLFTRRVCGQR